MFNIYSAMKTYDTARQHSYTRICNCLTVIASSWSAHSSVFTELSTHCSPCLQQGCSGGELAERLQQRLFNWSASLLTHVGSIRCFGTIFFVTS